MKMEDVFLLGLFAAVLFFVAILCILLVAIIVTAWRNVIKKPKVEAETDFDRIVSAARRGGAQVGDTE
jgi:ABC-type transport system involved in Fe-S cluster assembly fused permease/ATPase subunit